MQGKDDRKQCVAARLKAAREMAGLSQGQVAKMMKLHRPSISEIEAGRRRVSAEELSELAGIYGVSVLWLTCSDEGAEDRSDARLQLAARELSKLSPQDLEKLIEIINAIRQRGDDPHE